ncbi:hypothetical protein F3087_29445 [Nocardia colli]|uniref:Tat (Twin-arginine translocation) pathway signal sequence n=1 Tax=Nocardia colli TaxID=2545717 RepID=A0A5N0E8L3_9NOCA|nr:hypothetical protein F3087_29445 [Nocardia colli]
MLAIALAAAFVRAPRTLAANGPGGGFTEEGDLRDALRVAFVEYWSAGARDFPPSMARVVDYWFRYHIAKAAIAALLLIVLVALGARLWRAFLRTDGHTELGRAVLGAAAGFTTMLALGSTVLVMANIQGAVAPFASLLPMLTDGTADSALSLALEQIRQQLADSPNAGGRLSLILDLMISDFARYHAAMAVIAATVALILLALSVLCWRRFAGTSLADRRPRRLLASFGTLTAVLALATLVVAVANTGTAANPAPALAAFFAGGW